MERFETFLAENEKRRTVGKVNCWICGKPTDVGERSLKVLLIDRLSDNGKAVIC